MEKETIAQQPNQTLAKALLVLEAFDGEHPDWGVRELGRHLGINPASVYRMVATLHNAGYLEQDPETLRYSLGPKVMKLASLYAHRNPFPDAARKVFEQYASRFEYNFYLGTLSNYEVVYLAALDGRGPIKIVVETGGTTGLHSTALGKVLLAFQQDEYIHAFFETARLTAYTARSITDPHGLWQQIREIRAQRYALNDGEHYGDVGAVGVPVFDHSGRVRAGVSLAYPRHFVLEQRLRVDELVPLAREIASKIAVRLGPDF